MEPWEVNRIAELDRREKVTQYYSMKDGELKCHDVNWDVPQWNFTEKHEEWEPIAESCNNLWGAFDGNRLVGFSIYRKNLTENMAQLSLLHVSNGYRGRGIGKRLLAEAVKQAETDGKTILYVSSAPSKNTVDFYKNCGFILTDKPDRELLAMEPDDIHMIMGISPGQFPK